MRIMPSSANRHMEPVQSKNRPGNGRRNPIRILVLSPGFPDPNDTSGSFYGGSFVLTEALAYSRAGAMVKVLTPHVPGLKKTEKISERFMIHRFRYFIPEKMQKIRIKKAPLYSREHLFPRVFQVPIFLGAFFFSMARFATKADIIHANWTPLALLALPLQFLLKVPVVVTYRGSDIRLIPDLINKFVFSKVAAVLHIWGDTGRGRLIKNKYPGNFVELPIISRIAPEPPSNAFSNRKPGDPFGFAYIGRLATVHNVPKGEDILIQAASILRERHTNFVLHVLGDGPLRKAMEQKAKELHLESLIRFHGYVRDIFPILDKCQCVVGGLALNAVAQEAASYRRLLIIADFSPLNGTIWKHRQNALLYTPHDAKSMAEAMAFAMNHEKECKKISLAGYETMRRYVVNIETGGKYYVKAFRKIIAAYR
ncbi:MAG: hypothetical protein DRH12_10130 [Deltaproteobacteria bacterium]|nr:MAG: hypothetical protein DRH12_10130 [Deltaproteobacteria bacterium]